MVRIMLITTRLIQVTIVVGCLAVPFLTWGERIQPGTLALATGEGGHRIGDAMTVIADEGWGSDRLITVVWESGEPDEIGRSMLHPFDCSIGH